MAKFKGRELTSSKEVKVSGLPPAPVYQYTTKPSLLDIPPIKRVSQMRGFFRFTVTKEGSLQNGEFTHMIIAELVSSTGYYTWFPVGYIDEPFDLPEWKAK
jgi:hypothetical protein